MPAGRPREFNIDQALDQALAVFAAKGYRATSFTDLTAATGVAKPGLYKAFGNKDALFCAVVDRYLQLIAGPALDVLNSTDRLRYAVRGYLRALASEHVSQRFGCGCFFIRTNMDRAPVSPIVAACLADRANASKFQLHARIRRATAIGDFPAAEDIDHWVNYVSGQAVALAFTAQHGGTLSTLHDMIDKAMACWPDPAIQ